MTLRTAIAAVSCLTGACMMEAAGPARQQAIVVQNRALEDDLLAAGQQVQLRASVHGDVIAAGSRVAISGPVTGYAIAAGRNVDVTSRVSNDLLAAGESVHVGAPVGDKAILAGRTVRLSRAAEVGTAIIGAGTAEIEGRVLHDVKIGAESARIGGNIGGSVDARAGRVSVLPGAVIRGDLVVRASEPPQISPQAQVLGKVDYRKVSRVGIWSGWLVRWIFLFLAVLALGLAGVRLSPVRARRVGATIEGRPWASIWVGLAGTVGIPLLAVVLFVTLIGIPLGILLLAMYVVALLLATAFVAYEIGDCIVRWLTRSRPEPSNAGPMLRTFVGAILLSFALSLPWVGWIVQLAVVLLGLGAVLLECRNFRRQLRTAGLA